MAFVTPLTKSNLFRNHNTLSNRNQCDSLLIVRHNIFSSNRSIIKSLADSNGNLNGTDAPADKEARLELWREVEALKKSLNIAVNAERYVDAAKLRDQIQSLSLADDYVRTETELKKAVEEERFSDAAKLRDVLKLLEPPPGLSAIRGEQQTDSKSNQDKKINSNISFADLQAEDVETCSITITDGIKVYVESYYIPEQSVPEQSRFLFGYRVKIYNQSKDTCQLISRHWIIKSPQGSKSEVKGAGVIGKQPVLQPGESFEYTSACPISGSLKTGQSVVGSMQGHYTLCKGDAGEIVYNVDINPFHFVLPFKNFRPEQGSSSDSLWPKP